MIRQPDRLKEVANHLAEALVTPDGASVFRQVTRLLGGAVSAPDPARGGHPASSGPRRIGIWEPRETDGKLCFVRTRSTSEPASFWANVDTIPAKGERRRVVLLGESVARGYFLDPHFNPALDLQTMLRAGEAADTVEVVDLARTDLLLEPLVDLADAALALEPDAVVLFAGNNWRPMLHRSPGHLHDVATILEQNGSWSDVARHVARMLSQHVERAIDRLGSLARTADVPFIFVLPEFNLTDWRTDLANPPLLGADEVAQWHRVRSEGERALAEHDCELAAQRGLQLVELDGGSTPVGWNLMADAKIGAGDSSGAAPFLEAARDATICFPRPESPRCYAVVQQTIRRMAAEQGLLLVDLGQMLRERWPSGLPDRRMFFDYCHLTVDATHVAMAAVAEILRPRLGCSARPREALRECGMEVDHRVVAEAHFLAAIHNANWGQSADVVRHHCGKALETSADVAQMMALFLEAHARRTPSALCNAFELARELACSPGIGLLLNSRRPVQEEFLNVNLMSAIVDALLLREPTVGERLDRLIRQDHAVEKRTINLLERAYSAESFLTVPIEHARYGFYRAFTRTSQFRFVCGESQELDLTLTYRCRQADPDGSMLLCVNGRVVVTGPPNRSWVSARLVVPRFALLPGLNTLEIRWPSARWDVIAWKRSVADRFRAAQLSEVDPLWGEIHQLRLGRQQTTDSPRSANALALAAPQADRPVETALASR